MAGWKTVKTTKTPLTIGVSSGALRIDASANVHGGIERALPAGVRAVVVQVPTVIYACWGSDGAGVGTPRV